MNKEFIETAIANAESGKSKLSQDAMSVPGMTSPKIRHFLNNIGEASDISYLEIGIHKGATFVAANYKNVFLSSIAVDNWSEFCDDNTRGEFISNARRLIGTYTLLDQDCFAIKRDQLPLPINVYLYDGNHSNESQYKAVSNFYQYLDDSFVLMVDDWLTGAQEGTRRAIEDLKLKTIFETELSDGWWNGFFVALLEKQ